MRPRSTARQLMSRTLLVAVFAAFALPLHAAQVYRCVDASGRIEYRDAACAAHDTGGPVKIEPNVTPGMDPHAVQEANNAVAARSAARAAAEADAARARAPVADKSPQISVYEMPWWMVPGPPPGRTTGNK